MRIHKNHKLGVDTDADSLFVKWVQPADMGGYTCFAWSINLMCAPSLVLALIILFTLFCHYHLCYASILHPSSLISTFTWTSIEISSLKHFLQNDSKVGNFTSSSQTLQKIIPKDRHLIQILVDFAFAHPELYILIESYIIRDDSGQIL